MKHLEVMDINKIEIEIKKTLPHESLLNLVTSKPVFITEMWDTNVLWPLQQSGVKALVVYDQFLWLATRTWNDTSLVGTELMCDFDKYLPDVAKWHLNHMVKLWFWNQSPGKGLDCGPLRSCSRWEAAQRNVYIQVWLFPSELLLWVKRSSLMRWSSRGEGWKTAVISNCFSGHWSKEGQSAEPTTPIEEVCFSSVIKKS